MCLYNRKHRVRLFPLILCLLSALSLCSCFERYEPYTCTTVGMGTVISLKLYGGNESGASDICGIIEEIENASSLTIADSALRGLNAAGYTDNIHLVNQAKVCLDVSEKSGGAFDCTLGAVSALWGFGTEGRRVPEEAEILSALEHTGYEKLALSDNTLTCEKGMTVDFGAVGKGYACDAVREYLDSSEIGSAVISVGGSLLFYGQKNGGWNVAVKNPFGDSEYIFTFILTDTAFVSTSGSYERCFEEDGVNYHHILSPETGMPARTGLVSVTVVADSGALSDALSTACFVLGEEEGKKLLAEYGAGGVFVLEDGRVNVYGDI